jgi:hypothetical protein
LVNFTPSPAPQSAAMAAVRSIIAAASSQVMSRANAASGTSISV